MNILVALHHVTNYNYSLPVNLSPHVVRLRPAPHNRARIAGYTLNIQPAEHFINWQQDPYANYNARLVFTAKTKALRIEVNLVVELAPFNPFDFFLEQFADQFPFSYPEQLKKELQPYLELEPAGKAFDDYFQSIDTAKRNTMDFLVAVNGRLQRDIAYLIRMEAGIQPPDLTITNRSGSCRDSAWLLVQILRRLGLAARFVSGYLIQLRPDVKSLDGPSGTDNDFTDLHAWTEVYLPGAGWVGLDPTSGLLTSEGHIPLACAPHPVSAAPVTGAHDACEVAFDHEMRISRIYEDPRVTKPYSEEQWAAIDRMGEQIDEQLIKNDVRLTMGGEPTFVAIDNPDSGEWKYYADGPEKRKTAQVLLHRLRKRFGNGGLLHFGIGKWYPGESLPRWSHSCFWRADGEPVWRDDALIADNVRDYGVTAETAERFIQALAANLGVDPAHAMPAYEDRFYYLWKERKVPANVDPQTHDWKKDEERARLARLLERGLDSITGYVLPLGKEDLGFGKNWAGSGWPLRQDALYLIPGDSPLGLRLPLDSIPWTSAEAKAAADIQDFDPSAKRGPLKSRAELDQTQTAGSGFRVSGSETTRNPKAKTKSISGAIPNLNIEIGNKSPFGDESESEIQKYQIKNTKSQTKSESQISNSESQKPEPNTRNPEPESRREPNAIIHTALCVEPREGKLKIFLPPVRRLEDFLELIAAVENTAAQLRQPVQIEGYTPPSDHRLLQFKITPDPGVIEVNTQPAGNWRELREITTGLYEEAYLSRLTTEKFDLDGKHTGTGGGNHIVVGGSTPADSPFLRKPQLLARLLRYWHNHPSLSYLFSGSFIGPTSQAPRVDEARHESVYELELAMQELPSGAGEALPWLVDRIFRNLLIDSSGNTHRTEFCIDKLYSPDTASGRQGLVEIRSFEMPPHARMSLAQQLLMRALIAEFWQRPYERKLIRWGTALHDRFMLPHFAGADFDGVIQDLRNAGFAFERDWFTPHFEFRFPKIGALRIGGVEIVLHNAIEPWHVLGEEAGANATVRNVDSSLERIQVKVSGMNEERHAVTCNGRLLPLKHTGVNGEFVAGVRFRAWQPPQCLHPTIGVHSPLRIELIDTWNAVSLGGCTYHVAHPGGRNFDDFPVNSLAAAGRRAARFTQYGQSPGKVRLKPEPQNAEYPYTLDLRWRNG